MLTNRSRVVLYIGVTNNLEGRLWWHWNTEKNSFVKKYKLDRLVYYEPYDDVRDAIAREKQLKRWTKIKKIRLIVSMNPTWKDLAEDWFPELQEQKKKQMHRSFDSPSLAAHRSCFAQDDTA